MIIQKLDQIDNMRKKCLEQKIKVDKKSTEKWFKKVLTKTLDFFENKIASIRIYLRDYLLYTEKNHVLSEQALKAKIITQKT